MPWTRESCDVAPEARVSSFRLMRTEVTNAMYAECVREEGCPPPDADLSEDPVVGEWSSPEKANKPVALSHGLAERFCRFYGGEFPTGGQYARAMTAGEETFGIPELTRAFLACVTGKGVPELCNEFNRASLAWPYVHWRPMLAFGPRAMPEAGTTAWDEGPYGHRDLFGSALEWVRFAVAPPPSDCVPGWLEDERYGRSVDPPPERLLETVHPAAALGLQHGGTLTNWNEQEIERGPTVIVYTALRTPFVNHATGFRCAFPP
jgi:formylglycine-generating enzyme required for sulfatase activity